MTSPSRSSCNAAKAAARLEPRGRLHIPAKTPSRTNTSTGTRATPSERAVKVGDLPSWYFVIATA